MPVYKSSPSTTSHISQPPPPPLQSIQHATCTCIVLVGITKISAGWHVSPYLRSEKINFDKDVLFSEAVTTCKYSESCTHPPFGRLSEFTISRIPPNYYSTNKKEP